MKEKQIIVIIITVLFIIATGILYCFNGAQNESDGMIVTGNDTDTFVTAKVEVEENTSKTLIFVHICGEVKNPGVYEVKESDRVTDLILQAGGFTKKADSDSVNQAQHLTDGQKIYIPSKEEAKALSATDSKESALVNINTASLESLMTLPGIGESKAKSILQYREAHQGFSSLDEIKNIEGIKDGVFRKIKDFITIY